MSWSISEKKGPIIKVFLYSNEFLKFQNLFFFSPKNQQHPFERVPYGPFLIKTKTKQKIEPFSQKLMNKNYFDDIWKGVTIKIHKSYVKFISAKIMQKNSSLG